ncbi:MAG: branched-chain amino acid ABC transporter permease, partial [Ruthenibacterium sp.]
MDLTMLIDALMLGGIYSLIALGYSLIYQATGLMSFAQGDLFMLGAFLGYTFYSLMGMSFPIALLLSVVAMFFFGMLMERFMIRKIVDRGVNRIYVVLSTIGLSIILQNAATLIWGSLVYRMPSITKAEFIQIAGTKVAPSSLIAVGVSIVCMVCLGLFLAKTKLGTAMRATAQDRLAASSLGINVNLSTAITWGLATVLVAVAGIMYSPLIGVKSDMGVTIGMRGFAAAVIGGYGNLYGAVTGALLLGFLEIFVTSQFSSVLKDLFIFG